MDVELARRLEAGRHQHGRPDHGVEAQDVLAQQLPARRPVARRHVLARTGVGQRRRVVEQRVDPDVDRLIGRPRQRDAPVRRLTAHRDVVEAGRDEGACFVIARTRQDESGMRVVELKQPFLVRGQAEERVPLLQPRRRRSVLRAHPVDQVALAVEGLAGQAVQPRVRAVVQVSPLVQDGHEALDEGLVLGVGRADEEVVRRVDRPRAARGSARQRRPTRPSAPCRPRRPPGRSCRRARRCP